MKSGNPRRHPATSPYLRDPPPSRGGDPGHVEDPSSDRRLFVRHQQELARRALNVGSPGAARAALRALQAVDFEDSTAAGERLRVIRDASVAQDEVDEAIKELLRMEPLGGFPRDERPTWRLPRLVR